MWQAVRRIWRLGQKQPVRAIYAVYRGTMESTALALMGQKMRAAQLVYGDEVGGAIVPDDDGDSLMKLALEALNARDLPDLQSLFADNSRVSTSPLGSMTLPSAPLPSVVEQVASKLNMFDWIDANKAQVNVVSPSEITARKTTLADYLEKHRRTPQTTVVIPPAKPARQQPVRKAKVLPGQAPLF